jgi:hypothetical protein
MIEIILESIKTLSSLFSPDRLAQHKRSLVARSLARLHSLIHEIVDVGSQLIATESGDDKPTRWIPISIIEKHYQRILEAHSLLRNSPLHEVLQIHVPDYNDVHGLLNKKTRHVSFLLASIYGFTDNKTAEAEVNLLLRQIHLVKEPDIPEKYIWKYKSWADVDISLGEALELKEKCAYDFEVALYATPAHVQEALAVIGRLRETNEALRKFISSEFKPEELA